MKKFALIALALTLAAPAFAGNKKPVAPAPSGLVDSSGKAVTTEANGAVALTPAEVASVEPVKAPVKKPVKKVAKKKVAVPAVPAAPAAPAATH